MSVVVDGGVKVDLSEVSAHMGWVEGEGCSAEGKTLQRSPLPHTHSTLILCIKCAISPHPAVACIYCVAIILHPSPMESVE